jgi:V8-like Glu-specific endopeptidase
MKLPVPAWWQAGAPSDELDSSDRSLVASPEPLLVEVTMHPNRFDLIAKAQVARGSRRTVVGAAVAGIAGIGLRRRDGRAQTEAPPSPTSEPLPDFPPIFVEPAWFDVDDFPDFPIMPAIGTPIAAGTPVSEAICLGWDESQDIEQYTGSLGVSIEFVAAHQSPVGNLVWNSNLNTIFENPGNVNHPLSGEGLRYCSGTLIADDLFLTAAHCFDQVPENSTVEVPRINGTDSPISRADIAKNMHVGFNYQERPDGMLREEKNVAVAQLVEDGWGGPDGRNGVDYAIVRLAGTPGQEFGQARIAGQDAPVESTICIISHPEQDDNRNVKRIAAGPASAYDSNGGPKVIYRTIDTKAGSSGAGILASPEGNRVGIHTNGGCNDPWFFYNYGMRVGALLEVSAKLRELAAT